MVFLVLLGCGDDDSVPVDAGPVVVDAGGLDSGRMDAGMASEPLASSTTAWADGADVPERYRCGPPIVPDMSGGNVTPAMSWTGGPSEAGSWAVVVRDMSAGGLVHWAIYDIPVALRALPEDVPAAYMPLAVDGARQAEIQGSGFFGYFGPCSGGRGNTYVFSVHAMPDAMLAGVTRESTDAEIAAAIEAASLESASFTGSF